MKKRLAIVVLAASLVLSGAIPAQAGTEPEGRYKGTADFVRGYGRACRPHHQNPEWVLGYIGARKRAVRSVSGHYRYVLMRKDDRWYGSHEFNSGWEFRYNLRYREARDRLTGTSKKFFEGRRLCLFSIALSGTG